MYKRGNNFAVMFILLFLYPYTSALGEDCRRAVELYNKGTLSASPVKKERYFKAAIPLCSDPEVLSRVYNNLADTYEKGDRPSLAFRFYKEALKTKPDLATSYFSVGDIFFRLGDYYSAYIMYGKGLNHEPEAEEYLNKRQIAGGRFKQKMIVYFDFDSVEISGHYLYRLDLLGQSLRAEGSKRRKIKVIGYTCSTGSRRYNQGLSLRRARSVAEYLREHFSIEPARIFLMGQGEDNPLLPNEDSYARTLNRRVEVEILGDQ